MKKQLLFLLFALLTIVASAQRKPIGNLLVENIPDIPTVLKEKWEQYQNIRGANFSDWDASGKGIYIATRFADVAQIHHVNNAGGYREQVTFYKEPIGTAKVCPDPNSDGFLFSKDNGGNENFQIYYFDRKTGNTTLITDGKSRNGNAVWNKKGDKLAFTSNKRNGKDIDFYVASLSNPGDAKLLLQNTGGGWSMQDWMDDETKMVIGNYTSANESKLYLLDAATSQITPINLSEKQIAYSDVRFAKNGKGIYWLSDEESEFSGLWFYDWTTKKANKIVNSNWDIEQFSVSDDGNSLVFIVNESGYYTANLLDTKTNKFAPLNIPKGVISNVDFNKDNKRIAFTLSTSTAPTDVYVYDISKNSYDRWTFSEVGGLNPKNFTDAGLVTFPTFDKDALTGKTRTIPSFIYRPRNAKGKIPVVIDIHGGPEGQSFPNFTARRQFWANELGFAVLVPNVRGSLGYGKTYSKLDNGMLRENSVKDIGALLDWIATQPDLDTSRIAVFGGSYGGYMSLACMTNYNNRLRCGVDLFGISNFVTFLKNTSSYRADLRRVEYGDEREPAMAAFLQKISPLTNISNISKPMFVFQGENDPRVPLSESEQMLEQLKKNGVTSWYVRAKDEGHGIAKKANADYTYAAIALFLKTFL